MTKPEAQASKWATQERKKGWDYDEYHTRSTNTHDHSEIMRFGQNFKLPASLAQQIGYWIDHPLTSYTTPASFVRDACTHRAAYLREREGSGALQEFKNSSNFQLLQDQIAATEEFEREMEEGLAAVEKRARTLATKGNVRSLEALWVQAMQIQVEPEFRAEWKDLIDDIKSKCEQLLPKDV